MIRILKSLSQADPRLGAILGANVVRPKVTDYLKELARPTELAGWETWGVQYRFPAIAVPLSGLRFDNVL